MMNSTTISLQHSQGTQVSMKSHKNMTGYPLHHATMRAPKEGCADQQNKTAWDLPTSNHVTPSFRPQKLRQQERANGSASTGKSLELPAV